MRNLDRLEPDPPKVTTPYLVDGLGWFVEWPKVRSIQDRQQWSDPVGESVCRRVVFGHPDHVPSKGDESNA